MGAISCHHTKSQRQRSLIPNLELQTQFSCPIQNLDLHLRHYVHKGLYIPSALPHHHLTKFIPKNRILLSKDIQKSSIMMRRILENNHPLFHVKE